MKKHTLFFTTVLVTLLLAGCQQENPESAVPSEVEPAENEVVIPARLEGVTPGTRVETDGLTGISVWSDNDPIGLYVEGTAYDQYKIASVVDGSVRLSLYGDQVRKDFAIYPFSDVVNEHHTAGDLQVKYPTVYNVGLYSAAKLETWTPTPMVSLNTETELTFYHVGALLRIHLTDIPVGTTSLAFEFVGMEHITGNYAVSSPGTALATVSLAEGGGTGNTVTFSNITSQADMTFNIPLPTQDYSTLSALQITAKGTRTITAIKELSGWGALGHGEGKQMDFDFTTITYPAGSPADGRFESFVISPGILKWDASLNGGEGGYTLTKGDDPLEVLRYAKATEETTPSLNDIKDIYFHRRYMNGSTTTFKYRCDGFNSEVAVERRYIVVNGVTWRIPGVDEWNKMHGRSTNIARVNGITGARFCHLSVDLTGTEYEGFWGTSCDGELFFPNDAIISCPGIQTINSHIYNGSDGTITFRTLKKLLDGGCVYLPSAGQYNGNTWESGNLYCACSVTSTGWWDFIRGARGGNYFGDNNRWLPCRLIHD